MGVIHIFKIVQMVQIAQKIWYTLSMKVLSVNRINNNERVCPPPQIQKCKLANLLQWVRKQQDLI